MLPQTISTCVSQDAMKKVTRLFNNTIEDVLAELIQNARRAGASAITLETRTEDALPIEATSVWSVMPHGLAQGT